MHCKKFDLNLKENVHEYENHKVFITFASDHSPTYEAFGSEYTVLYVGFLIVRVQMWNYTQHTE
jgi:hypothetical protein